MNLKSIIPCFIVSIRKRIKIKRRWPSCIIKSTKIDLSGKLNIGYKVHIPATSEMWGGYIGDYSYIGDYCSIPYAKIGSFVSIGSRCSIGGWQHDYYRISTSPRLYREILNQKYEDQKEYVIIGNDVWIGDNVVILRGCIGDGAIIGAGSVVTKDVPPYAIAVGNPAKVIKYRFDETTINKLLNEKWWTNTEKKLIEYIKQNVAKDKQCE